MHPTQPEQESIFKTVFAGRVEFGGVFRRFLRATTKKKVVNFFGKKKCTPRQNPGYAYASTAKKNWWELEGGAVTDYLLPIYDIWSL